VIQLTYICSEVVDHTRFIKADRIDIICVEHSSRPHPLHGILSPNIDSTDLNAIDLGCLLLQYGRKGLTQHVGNKTLALIRCSLADGQGRV
jgi:hypothetical protein